MYFLILFSCLSLIRKSRSRAQRRVRRRPSRGSIHDFLRVLFRAIDKCVNAGRMPILQLRRHIWTRRLVRWNGTVFRSFFLGKWRGDLRLLMRNMGGRPGPRKRRPGGKSQEMHMMLLLRQTQKSRRRYRVRFAILVRGPLGRRFMMCVMTLTKHTQRPARSSRNRFVRMMVTVTRFAKLVRGPSGRRFQTSLMDSTKHHQRPLRSKRDRLMIMRHTVTKSMVAVYDMSRNVTSCDGASEGCEPCDVDSVCKFRWGRNLCCVFYMSAGQTIASSEEQTARFMKSLIHVKSEISFSLF